MPGYVLFLSIAGDGDGDKTLLAAKATHGQAVSKMRCLAPVAQDLLRTQETVFSTEHQLHTC